MPAGPCPNTPPHKRERRDPALVEAMNEALHALILGLRLHRLDSWDPLLKGPEFHRYGHHPARERDPDLIL
jgi:hypothetical protein